MTMWRECGLHASKPLSKSALTPGWDCTWLAVALFRVQLFFIGEEKDWLSRDEGRKKSRRVVKTFISLPYGVLPMCPDVARSCDFWVYVTQPSRRIRLEVGLSPPSARPSGREWKSGLGGCSSRSLPPSWELQDELTLSAGDLPTSAWADEDEWGRGWATYPGWLRRSRGGERGSALMLMLWFVPTEKLELPDLQTQRHWEAVEWQRHLVEQDISNSDDKAQLTWS